MTLGSSSGGSAPKAGGGTHPPTGSIGRYQVLERIGEGGMGSLYMARDPAIERLLAIKVLRRGVDTEELRERFAREARAAGRLRHPNIVTIFDVGEHDGDPFIAMEFLPGETLAEMIRGSAHLRLTRRLKLIEELCDGLGYAHRAGIIHRDIKPANLMVDADGLLKILDFGIVRFGESGMTQSGMLVGTVNYMSPEQVMGGAIDARSDIFAVGAVAYELLSYKQAFPGSVGQGLFNRILNVSLDPLAEAVPGLDPAIVAAIERALQREPADRYQNLVTMRNDLSRVRLGLERADTSDEIEGEMGETAALPQPLIADAERALTAGEFRRALVLAGRSAAENPNDRTAQAIVERAHAALLERGRQAAASGAGAAAYFPVPRSTAGSGRGSRAGAGGSPAGANRVFIFIAAAALLIAATAVFVRIDRRIASVDQNAQNALEMAAVTPASAERPGVPAASTPAPAAPDPPAVLPPAAESSRGPEPAPRQEPQAPRETPPPADPPRASAPARPPQARPPAPAPRTGTPEPDPVRIPRLYTAPSEVPAPRRIRTAEPEYPDAARAARVQGTVGVELTIGREGRVAEAKVVRSVPALDQAALSAVRRWEFLPTLIDGAPVPVVYVVDVPFVLEEPAVNAATTPAAVPSRPTPPVRLPPPPARETAARPSPPAPSPAVAPKPDPAAETNAIRELLRRYEAAWEALDVNALGRTRILSGRETDQIRTTMEQARAYEVNIDVQAVEVAPGSQTATARANVLTRYTPRRGERTDARVVSTFQLEKRGGNWIITGIQ